MATIEQLAEGIKRAHAAGDAESVKKLGAAYRQMQSAPPSDAFTEATANASAMTLKGKVDGLPSQRPSFGDEAMSFGRGVIDGIPIVGPTLTDWRQGLDANISALATGGDADEIKAGYKAADEELESKTGGARLAGNVTGAVAALAPLGATAVGGRLLGTVGTLGQRAATGLASGAVISAADTAVRGGDLGDVGTSAGVGAAVGGALPFVGAGIRRLISPSPAAAGKQAAAATLRNEGVELTAGQATGNKGLQYREAELGGNAASDFMERQADSFTAAALRRAGINATRATPDVIDQADTRIGQTFNDLAARNDLVPDQRLAGEIRQVWQDYSNLVGPADRAPIIQNTLVDVANAINNGGLPGATYKSVRSRLARASRTTKDPELKMALRDIMASLDGAMERTIAQSNPADLGAWQEVRRAYRNMLVIEDAATRAGEKAADGIITPAALRGAAKNQGRRAFSRGQNDFAALANAGVSAMTPLPESGTAQRLAAKMLLPVGAATGAGLGGTAAGPLGALVGGLAGAAVPWAAGRAMLSGPGRAYLGNQLAAGGAGRGALPPAILSLLATDN